MSRDQTTKKLMEEMKAHQQKKARSSVTTEEFRPEEGPEEAQDPLGKRTRELLEKMKLLLMTTPSQNLVKEARAKCTNQTVLKWLRDNSTSQYFANLEEIFNFLKKKIDEEEKKDHSNIVDITILCHGAIRDVMIPACCLMPLPSIADVVLYNPWNCSTSATVSYAVATGRLRFSHRHFRSNTNSKAPAPDKLPNRWNSMKEAGEQMIPNITISPKGPNDTALARYLSLQKIHGPPGRNRIVIPFTFPEVKDESVPLAVVTLALSLALDSSRFTATVHLNTCLGDQSSGQKFDPEYLRSQYAYTDGDATMMVLDNVFT